MKKLCNLLIVKESFSKMGACKSFTPINELRTHAQQNNKKSGMNRYNKTISKQH
jgi:hypothetical protein